MKHFVILNMLLLLLNPFNLVQAKSVTNNIPIQEDGVENIVISYLDGFSYQLDENTSWSIRDPKENITLKSGLGSIDHFLFPSPGNYAVEILEKITVVPGECDHPQFPNKIIVNVSPMKMEFNFSSIKLSNELIGGQLQDGNVLTIDVNFSNVKNESVEFNAGYFTSAGVGVDLKGELQNGKVVLKPGINHLTYLLTGHATSQTFIMFDFFDINNQIVSYYLPNKIK